LALNWVLGAGKTFAQSRVPVSIGFEPDPLTEVGHDMDTEKISMCQGTSVPFNGERVGLRKRALCVWGLNGYR